MLHREELDMHDEARVQFFFAKLPRIEIQTGVRVLPMLLIMDVLVFPNNQVTSHNKLPRNSYVTNSYTIIHMMAIASDLGAYRFSS
jgi:hypothetical protein